MVLNFNTHSGLVFMVSCLTGERFYSLESYLMTHRLWSAMHEGVIKLVSI